MRRSRHVTHELDRQMVLEHIDRTGCSAKEAARHFRSDLSEVELDRISGRIRNWLHRRKRSGGSSPAAVPGPIPPRVEISALVASAGTTDLLEAELQNLIGDLARARAKHDGRTIVQLSKEVRAANAELAKARAEEGRIVKLDRNPGAVAAEVLRQHKALQLLAEAHEAADGR